MNIFFVTDRGLVTPKLTGTFLAEITRDSLLRLAPTLGIKAEERTVAIEEVVAGLKNGRVREIFATGTAAALWPITDLCLGDDIFTVADGAMGQETERLRKTLTGIQYGCFPDRFDWMLVR